MQKTEYMVFAGRQYFLGDKCQVKLCTVGTPCRSQPVTATSRNNCKTNNDHIYLIDVDL